jgi:hypothetical protein
MEVNLRAGKLNKQRKRKDDNTYWFFQVLLDTTHFAQDVRTHVRTLVLTPLSAKLAYTVYFVSVFLGKLLGWDLREKCGVPWEKC